jgi:uncharacterized peroxidase-related enzyme
MTFIETVPVDAASGLVAEQYEADRTARGNVPNYTRAFSHRPDVYAAWQQLSDTVRGNMELRTYELATFAAARRLRSSYCMLAHGSLVLQNELLGTEELRSVVTDHRAAGLDPAEVAVMDLAEKVADDATSVTEADVDRLRSLGLSETEILDVVLAAALRSFFSKVLDGVGAQPDAEFEQRVAPELREALVVGRPIATG